ncbi:MAG: succinate dehydrogenase, hydrophobic membrane anchor protein [Alphaproteobacteria bacterium]|nr:succinate dehydrogenase, hydrophobic membrane anchor protein [Alphaproteobacteria bacterium]
MADSKLTETSLRSPLGRVRGLGSAKEGVSHWWAQRVTAVALVPLTLWFVFSIAVMAGADHAAVRAWIAAPFNTVLLVLLVVATFHHAQLGLQVVIEDYIHAEGAKLVWLLLMKGLCLLLGLTAILSILRIAFA